MSKIKREQKNKICGCMDAALFVRKYKYIDGGL